MNGASRPKIIACANLAWNLVNFRAGLFQALRDAGFEVIAVAPPDPAMQDRLEAMGCRFLAAPVDAMGISPFRDLKTLLAFRRIVRATGDAVWLSWTIKPNIYGSFAAGLCGIPALPNVSGLGTVFIRRGPLTLIAKFLYRTAFSRSRAVFFQNVNDRDLFISSGMVRPSQARLVPGSGIDTDHYSAAPALAGPPRRFLMVSRLLGDKGVREYVAAIRLVRSAFPTAEFSLMGALDVANRTAIRREELAAWIAQGLITYLPHCDDVRPAMAGSDWIVLPSYREGLSRVLLEAGALGRPAITTNVPGCRDVIDDGVNGFLTAPRDPASLAEAIGRAMRLERSEWETMARAARSRVAGEFSQDRVNQIYLDEIRATLSK